VVGPVIQATGRLECEDGLGLGDLQGQLADQLLATGVLSHREELIQCISLHYTRIVECTST
jgi:hypothetical protein